MPSPFAIQDQDVAEAVAHHQIQKSRTIAGDHREPGGIVADRDAEGVLERAIPERCIDPDLPGVFHQHGEI